MNVQLTATVSPPPARPQNPKAVAATGATASDSKVILNVPVASSGATLPATQTINVLKIGNPAVFEAIKGFLQSSGVPFRTMSHAPTKTSQESADVRGIPLEQGAKAMLLDCRKKGAEPEFILFVLSAKDELDTKIIKKTMGFSDIRFASPDDLYSRTGLVPGSVPPFGQPILPFRLFVENHIKTLPQVAFNAGLLTESILMSDKYIALLKPEQFMDFRKIER